MASSRFCHLITINLNLYNYAMRLPSKEHRTSSQDSFVPDIKAYFSKTIIKGMITVFENHRKSLIFLTWRAKLRVHFETTKVHKKMPKMADFAKFENLKLAIKQCYQTGQY